MFSVFKYTQLYQTLSPTLIHSYFVLYLGIQIYINTAADDTFFDKDRVTKIEENFLQRGQ